MADMCEYCLKMIKNHWNESSDGYHSFCSFRCQEKWQKTQDKLDDWIETVRQDKRRVIAK